MARGCWVNGGDIAGGRGRLIVDWEYCRPRPGAGEVFGVFDANGSSGTLSWEEGFNARASGSEVRLFWMGGVEKVSASGDGGVV